MSYQPPNNDPWQQPPQQPYPDNQAFPQQPPNNEQWHQSPQQPYPDNQVYPQQPPPQTDYGQPQWQQQQPYLPQQPMYQPQFMQQPPVKKSKTWLWIVLGVVAVVVLGCIGVSALAFYAAKNAVNSNVSTIDTAVATTASGNTPAPSSQHFAVGQVVKVDDTWNVTVNSVKTSQGDQISVPKSGNTYIIIDLSMKNISAQEQDVSSLISFNLLDSTGQKYTEAITTMSDIHPPDGKVEAGAPLRGQLVYEVPLSMKNYTLSFQADITSSGQTIWDIHV
jgi:flagellar basal body-associated protein FliL